MSQNLLAPQGTIGKDPSQVLLKPRYVIGQFVGTVAGEMSAKPNNPPGAQLQNSAAISPSLLRGKLHPITRHSTSIQRQVHRGQPPRAQLVQNRLHPPDRADQLLDVVTQSALYFLWGGRAQAQDCPGKTCRPHRAGLTVGGNPDMAHPLGQQRGYNILNAMPIGICLDHRTKPSLRWQPVQCMAQVPRDLRGGDLAPGAFVGGIHHEVQLPERFVCADVATGAPNSWLRISTNKVTPMRVRSSG